VTPILGGPPRPDEVDEIVVVRALALGDLLCAVPFLRALRGRFPGARIALVGLPWAATFVERFHHYLDALTPFPGWPGLPEVPFEAPRTLRYLAASAMHPPDLAIQAHGSGRNVNAFVRLLGARTTAGFVPAGTPVAVDHRGIWIPYPGDLPEVRRHLRLAESLGADASDDRLEWPVRDVDREEAAAALAPWAPVARSYAVIHAGAAAPIRRWPAGRFAAVADHLAARGLRIVLTGTTSEAPVTADVAAAMRTRGIDLAGRTSLGALGALIAGARLVVANDTGVAHLADAVGTPSVRIFRASDPGRWAALDASRHAALVPPDLGPRCAQADQPGHPDCELAGCRLAGAEPAPSRSLVPVAAAVEAVDRLLSETAADAA
jgi:ADP-heptose:LPS heptosyltransferase